MPGRVSVRSSRQSTTASRRASTQAPSRTSSARPSAFATEVPDEGESTDLRVHICSIFSDAQRGTAAQRKLAVNLRKVQEVCAYEDAGSKQHGTLEEFDEEQFNDEVGRCILRIMTVKKSEPVGDRIVRFLTLFLKYASDKDNTIARGEDTDDTVFLETPTSRLVSHIISLILPLLLAKDKTVRFRATQMIAQIVNTLDSIDDELFQLLRMGLLRRLRDKENTVRVQAVLGLGRLADESEDGQEDEDSDDDDAGGVLEKLLDVLQNDPSADVRRALLLNLPFTPGTLPYLLERARDSDTSTRRALYARLLPALGDFRHLSLTHREKLLRWGLRDRDENVRKATARLFRERWIEDCAGLQELAEGGDANKAAEPSFDALLELLERIDVINSGIEGGVALEAMKEFWEGRPDYREHIRFEGKFWEDLTAESSFVARTYNHFCRLNDDSKLISMVEDRMPEVTRFAFILQKHLTVLLENVRRVALAGDEDDDVEDDTVQQEFCTEQLLHIALTLDYTDEIGRRKMFAVMREALSMAELPEECTKLVVEVLRTICGSRPEGEREFCGIVLEAVAEVHDTIMGDDDPDASFHSARSELTNDSTPKAKSSSNIDSDEADEDKAIREIMVNMKCLHIAQCMLQNVQCDLEQNAHLVTMLNNLVVPAVRSQEAPIRERGLVCLGLCCLLSKNLAAENLTLFLHCFSKGHEALQSIAIQIITDILMAHPSLLGATPPGATPSKIEDGTGDVSQAINPLLKPIYKMYSRSLKSVDADVQTTGAVSLSKLKLASSITDADLLKQIVLAYFDPDTQSNPSLRQALSYFIPVYCHSRKVNSERMARIAVSVVHSMAERVNDLDEEEEIVGLNVVIAQLADWTDPRKLVNLNSAIDDKDDQEASAHVVLAEQILEKVLTPGCSREEKKSLFSMLGKLYINPNTPAAAAQELSDLVDEALEMRTLEAAAKNTLNKLQIAVGKILAHVESSPEDLAGGAVDSVDVEDQTIIPQQGTPIAPPADDPDGATPEIEDDSVLDSLLEDEGTVQFD